MNNLNGFMKLFYDIGNWMFKLMHLQLLWAVFSILGLIVFGIFPATAGVFAVTRKWVENDVDIPIFKTFITSYKDSFAKVNGVGFIMLLIGLFLGYDYIISKNMLNLFFLHMVLITIIFVYALTLCYLFPTFVHYELKSLQYIKQSFLIMVASPLENIGIILCLVILYYLYALLPVSFVLLGITIAAYPLMRIAYSAFNKVQQKKSVEN